MLLHILAACSWDLNPGETSWVEEPFWDTDVFAAADGVYVRLPEAGQLIRVQENGTWATVDLDGARPDRAVLTPDGLSLLVFASWPVCDDDDPSIRTVEDCPAEKLTWDKEVELVRDGERVGGAALEGVDPQATAATFSPDNGLVALYYDFETTEVEVDGVLDPTAVTFLDLATGEAHPVSIGFPAETVTISPDGSTAVVLSRSEVAVVALTSQDECGQYSVCTRYPLSLDADTLIRPTGVALMTVNEGGDDVRYAMVTVSSRSELYLLDLTHESIDIKELRAAPSAIALVDGVDEDGKEAQRAVVVYAGSPWVDTIDDQVFEVSGIELDEAMNSIEVAANDVVLYNTSAGHDVYHFDPFDGWLYETRAENPVDGMVLADDALAIGLQRPESSYGSGAGGFYDQNYVMGLFDLVDEDGLEPRDPIALVLESAPVGMATVTETDRVALLLLSGVDSLLKVNLETGAAEAVSLDAPPLGLSTTPAGDFVVAHDAPLGLISFVSSAGEVTSVAGFASVGLVHENILPRREE